MTAKQSLSAIALLSCLCTATVQAQSQLHISNGCNFYGKETETDYYQFEPSNEARQIVNELLEGSGLSSGAFQLKESNCKNALATTVNGTRLILYNPDFLRKTKQDAHTKWAVYAFLAHEMGHHLSGHNLSETDPSVRKRFELEADRFAGNLLFHLHATAEEAQSGIQTIALEGESSTHPPKSARLVATTNGWTAAYDLSIGRQPKVVEQPRANVEKPVKPTPTKAEMPTFTEVSDRLLEYKLVGKWTSKDWSVTFSPDGNSITQDLVSLEVDSNYTWKVKNGNLISIDKKQKSEEQGIRFIDENTFEVSSKEGEAIRFKRVK